MRTVATVMMVWVTLAGCGKKSGDDTATRIANEKTTLAPLIEKHRATAGSRFETLQKVDAEAISAPTVTAVEPLAAKLRSSIAVPSQSDLEDDGILIASPGWLAGPSAPPVMMPLWPSRVPGPELKMLFAEGYWDTSGYANPAAVEGALAMLAKVNHIIFVRTHTYTEPIVDNATKTFTPPEAAGDVVVYSVPEGRRAGAFPFQHAFTREKLETSLDGVEAVKLTFKAEVLRKIIDEVVEAN